MYFQFSKFQKGHNSHKNWRKLTTFEFGRGGIYWHIPQSEYTANGVLRSIRGFYFSCAKLTSASAIQKQLNYECVNFLKEKIPWFNKTIIDFWFRSTYSRPWIFQVFGWHPPTRRFNQYLTRSSRLWVNLIKSLLLYKVFLNVQGDITYFHRDFTVW